MKSKQIMKTEWREATERSSELFREVDRLDDMAYQLLSVTPVSPEAADKFHEAKNEARAKYVEARQAWSEAKIKLVELKSPVEREQA